MIGTLSAILASSILTAIAALHVYWGLGGTWPAEDEPGLTATVFGPSPDGRMPGFGPCFVVTVLLMLAAAFPLAAQGILPASPSALIAVGLWGAAAVLAIRGLGGFLERRIRPAIVGLPYDRLNRRLYSPLCLLLSALLISSATLT